MKRSAKVVVVIGIALTCCTVANAASFTSARSGAWSDPSTWGTTAGGDLGRRIPSAGDDVFVASGTTVIMDSKLADGLSAMLSSVSVQSQAVLTCPRNADLTTTSPELGLATATLRIESGGCFSCGYGNCTTATTTTVTAVGDAEPFAGKFVLRLTSPAPPPSTNQDVRTLMVESGGSLFLRGAPRARSITRLAADAEAGEATLRIANADVAVASNPSYQPWRIGDRVAIGPTDSMPSQTEYASIVGLEENGAGGAATLTLSDPLKYSRNGRILSLTNRADSNRQVTVDTRAEVALLSRNVVIEGTNDAVTGLGGDLMMAGDDVRARLSWVELRYLGRRGHLARYPLHIHNLGDSGRNVYVSNVAIHSSFQRGVVVHCTNGVTLVNNTVAGSPGFAYMLEDGAEENNTLIGNYAIDVRPADYPLIQTERVNSAGFWFVNAANTFVGNVAAGVAGVGFSLDMDPVLNSRPATLSTCPERLPGYDAKLFRDNVPEFNRLVNTALIKKNFMRFDDNVVHSAHSGLWMSYPFTPMFFVERPVPIARFTAWNIAARQTPSLASSDGVSLQFDGCLRLQGQRGMHIYQLTCVNSDAMATWASCVNTFEGTTIAWVGGNAWRRSGDLQLSKPPPAAATKSNGIMLSHLEPQLFLRTQVSSGSDSFPSPLPLLATVSKGGPLAALNTISGLKVDGWSISTPLIQLNAGDMHVFMDVVGDAFGSGPGATIAATAFNASGVDPLIEVYAPGQCTTGSYDSKRSSREPTSSLLPSGRAVSVSGGLPMLCRPARGSDGPLRFSAMSLALFHSANGAKASRSSKLEVDVGMAGTQGERALRRTSFFPVMLPLNAASMHPVAGGYSVRPRVIDGGAPFGGANLLEITLTPTIQPSDGMTFVISGMPPNARVSPQQPGGVQPIVQDGPSAFACLQIAGQCATAPRATTSKPEVCVCFVRNMQGEMVVRVQAALVPRDIGLATQNGSMLGVYDFPVLRIVL